jgi:hypothetical protein
LHPQVDLARSTRSGAVAVRAWAAFTRPRQSSRPGSVCQNEPGKSCDFSAGFGAVIARNDAQLRRSTGNRQAHSHWIVLSDDNALIFQRKFFCARGRTVSLIRQKFALLISKGKFCGSESSRFQRLSASIGRF